MGDRFRLHARMNPLLKKVGLTLLLAGATIQLVRPELNNRGAVDGPKSLEEIYRPPALVREALRNACYNCHADYTTYRWFEHVQPLAWLVESDIKNGKRAVNFSRFADLSPAARVKRMTFAMEAMREGAMPMWRYLVSHPESKLTPAQIEAVEQWVASMKDQEPTLAK